MKKFIVSLMIFSTLLLADGASLVLKSFHTNEEINITNIEKYISNFKTQTQDEKDVDFEVVLFDSEEDSTLKQNDKDRFTWVMLCLLYTSPSPRD